MPRRSSTKVACARNLFGMETTIQLDEQLLAQANQYAEQARRSLSQLVAEALREKLQQAPPPPANGTVSPDTLRSLHPDIQRITGLAPADLDAEAVYRQHLAQHHQ